MVVLVGARINAGPRDRAQSADSTADDLSTAVEEYRRGDVDKALARFRMVRHGVLSTGDAPVFQITVAMLHTELAMQRNTFGRYSRTAPLTPSPPGVRLTGAFELDSLIADRLVADALSRARARGPLAAVEAGREWYVLAASYCLRWNLDCADALAAEAWFNFPGAADILLLDASVSEARGRWRDAEDGLRRALVADAHLAEAHVRLSRVLIRLGRLDEARREAERAMADARDEDSAFSRYFALLTLADLDARAGQMTSARTSRLAAAALHPFDAMLNGEGLTTSRLYASAQYWQQSARLAAIRRVLRP
jgi:tetratricopeptide (TPR) repeat protein